MADDIARHDEILIRCPRLGHEVRFAYCRSPAAPLPCGRIFDCWRETFDIEAFVGRHFTPRQIEQIRTPPADKMLTLIELIAKAQKPQTADGPDGGTESSDG